MSNNVIDDYSWASAEASNSCGNISPEIHARLKELDVKRVLDVGDGNGKLCLELTLEGYHVACVEYDKQRSGYKLPTYFILQSWNTG